jgi:excisionase family DNA binding protein
MQLQNPERAALRITEFARAIGCSTDTVRRQVAAGKLKAIRFSRRVLIPISELRRILTAK